MKAWNEQQRAAVRRQSKEKLASDYETFAIQSMEFMRQRDELMEVIRDVIRDINGHPTGYVSRSTGERAMSIIAKITKEGKEQ